jgi:hypothetical protein
MHLTGNMLIDFADDANALVETYSFAFQRYLPEDAVTRKAIAGGAELGDQEFDMVAGADCRAGGSQEHRVLIQDTRESKRTRS